MVCVQLSVINDQVLKLLLDLMHSGVAKVNDKLKGEFLAAVERFQIHVQDEEEKAADAAASGQVLRMEVQGLVKIADKQYQCLKCSKIFPSSHNAQRHYKNAHMDVPKAECPICQKIFKNDNCLQVHVSRVHKLKMSALKMGLISVNTDTMATEKAAIPAKRRKIKEEKNS